jgi:hypothetical protein
VSPEGAFLVGLIRLLESRAGCLIVAGSVISVMVFVYLLGPAQLWDAVLRHYELRRARWPWRRPPGPRD